MTTMKMQIGEWWRDHPDKNRSVESQVEYFIHLGNMVGVGLSYDDRWKNISAISTHRSKSCLLPVVEIVRPDLGLRLTIRDNFYDFKLSVESDSCLIWSDVTTAVFPTLFYTTPPPDPEYTGDHLASVYFEGFPKDRIFGYYQPSGGSRFSASICGREEPWTVIFLIMREVGAIKPLERGTRKTDR